MRMLLILSEIINKLNIKIGKIFSWLLLLMVVVTCLIVILRYLLRLKKILIY